ncbi:MAG: GntR family transcriptional regulator [Pseudomonadota bacterium]|nr:GntR family transcriptional regulator [Pseudomonadota bacterium]
MQSDLIVKKDSDYAVEQPRYRQIYTMLRERIADGTYPVGSNLPTEVEMCKEFSVSRYTVREALRRLADQGVLARRQGSGSAVIASEPQLNYIHQVRSLADLFQFALDTHFVIRSVSETEIGAEIAESVGGEPGSKWLLVEGIRYTRKGGEPICVTHSYIPARLAWIEPEIPDCVGPFYALLERRSGESINEAVQEIKAERMTREIAEGLNRHEDDVTLRVLRRYSSRKGTLIASFNWHPGDTFTYRMDVQRRSGQ